MQENAEFNDTMPKKANSLSFDAGPVKLYYKSTLDPSCEQFKGLKIALWRAEVV